MMQRRKEEALKKAYSSPKREVHGDIRDVTRGGSGGSTKDHLFNFDGADAS